MMNPDIVSLVEEAQCGTSVVTNGGIGNENTWVRLAQQKVEIIFSIDGLEDTNHLYRQDVVWDKVMERVKWFTSNGGRAIWKWVVFRHNYHQIDTAKKLSKKLGFERFQVENHGRNYGPASDTQGNITHWILPHDDDREPDPAWVLGITSVKEKVERYKRDNDNFLQYQNKVYQIDCEHEKQHMIYISAKGEIFPCCYQGFDLPNRGRVTLDQFSELKKTWRTKNCDKICAQSCGS
jgi:sulfatase maturation enzyme AslB (radical SAM superfamily)